jgi:hypothetical protein
MHKRLTMAFVAMLLIVALALPLATLAGPQTTGSQAPSKAAASKAGKEEPRERHPAIHQAIRQLEHAKMILQKEAARDFEGHRAKAVKEIDEALADLRLALQADKR